MIHSLHEPAEGPSQNEILKEIRSLHGRIEANRMDIRFCEARISELTKLLTPLPPPTKKWWKDAVALPCYTCDRETKHRYGGLPMCYLEIHKASVKSDTKGVPDDLWKMILGGGDS